MIEKEEITERDLSIRLRSELHEDTYWMIAETNPMRYLGET